MNYHILNVNDKASEARIAFHIAVPNETNIAGVNLQTAMKQFMPQTTQIPWDIGTESADITNGAIFEIVETIGFNAHFTDAEKLAVIKNRWTDFNNTVPDIIRTRLRYWGIGGDV